MTEVAADLIDPRLARLEGHNGNARDFLRYVFDCQARIVIGRRIWSDACIRMRDSADFVDGETLNRFTAKLRAAGFGYGIFFALACDEHAMATCADCTELIGRFLNKFPG